MEHKRKFGPPRPGSQEVEELRQKFWNKQPEHRRLQKYKSLESTVNSEDEPTIVPRTLGVAAVREQVAQAIPVVSEHTPTKDVFTDVEYDDETRATESSASVKSETTHVPTDAGDEETQSEQSNEYAAQYKTPEQVLEVLDQQRPHYAQMYRTALELFPSIRSIRQIGSLIIDANSRENDSGGVRHDSTGEMYPEIRIGEAPLLPIHKERMKKRFGYENLSNEDFDGLPHDFWMQYIFAHEIGHAIQNDRNFKSIFGDMKPLMAGDDTLSQRNYKAYVNLEAEKNADYIAQMIVSNSTVGQQAKLPQPTHPPREWRKAVADL